MKVSAIVTAANKNDRWAARFPTVDSDKCFPVINGKMDARPDECFRQLSMSQMIQGVNFREKYLNQVVASWIMYINRWKEENCMESGADGISTTLQRIERRYKRGSSARVVATWHEKGGNVISLTFKIDNNDVFENREYERIFAWKMAEAAKVVSEDLMERGLPGIDMDESVTVLIDELEKYRQEKQEEREIQAMNDKRKVCKHYMGGFCVASEDGELPDFGCRCYQCGKCIECTARQ